MTFGYTKQKEPHEEHIDSWVRVNCNGMGYAGKLKEYNGQVILNPSLMKKLNLSNQEKDIFEVIEKSTVIQNCPGLVLEPLTKENLEFLLKKEYKNPDQLDLF